MSSYERQSSNSFLLAAREWQAIGGATGLMILNVILMYAVAFTPLAGINRIVFAVPIVGSLVYGAVITVGELLAERGFKNNTTPLTLGGRPARGRVRAVRRRNTLISRSRRATPRARCRGRRHGCHDCRHRHLRLRPLGH